MPREVNIMSPNKTAIFTNDVETHSVWFNDLRDETGLRVWREGMPRVLDLLAKYGVTSTFFFTGYIARLYPDVVKMVLPYGHEVGCHGLSHLPENGFDVMPFEKQKRHLVTAKAILENICGREVISFRAPALRVNQSTTRALIESGFRIDSSISSQRFDFFFSFGSLEKLKFLRAPRLPYRTSVEHLHRRGDGPLVEVPVSALVLPYIGSTLRAFPALTKMLRALLVWESGRNGKPILFYSHPAEILDEREELGATPRINRRVKGTVEYWVRDQLKSRIKHRNLGPPALLLLERELKALKESGCSFRSVRDYCEAAGLLSVPAAGNEVRAVGRKVASAA
jgi:peptidoglycan-N-acetylglucosamine deacetylase